jgi:SAM-dependent methyltransferase
VPKPRADLASTFRFDGVAEAYRGRPPYPDEAIEMLASLAGSVGGRVLDLGAGEGALARPLAALVAHVDAVEASPAMVLVGQTLPGGIASNLSWHVERAERLSPSGPFDLVVAGAAMHWFDLDTVCQRLSLVVVDQAPLALCDRSARHPGLAGVVEVIRRYSRAPEYDPEYDVADDLAGRGLWAQHGTHHTQSVVFRQSPSDYLLSLRSTSTLARELMTESENDAFDREILQLAEPLAEPDGLITFALTSTIVWGSLT